MHCLFYYYYNISFYFCRKTAACHFQTIKYICNCLEQFKKLSENCIQDLIKIVGELSQISIRPIELKNMFKLLRTEKEFPKSKELIHVSFHV